jgi:PilZ domain
MDEEKREAERIEILGDLPGDATVVQPLAVKELSRRGAQVETSFALQVDSLHEFRIALGDHSVVVKGRVAHCRISDVDQSGLVYRAGVEFIDPPTWAANAIAQFIEDLKTGRRG